jgi:hypothetical protein
MTINKIEIYNSTTAEWVTIASTPKTVDIASASAGVAIGSMTNADVTLPFGSYTKVKATVSDTFTIKACSGNGGSTCTTATKVSGNDAALVATSATAIAGSVIVNSGVDLTETITLTTPFEMTAATTGMSSTVSFDLNNVFTYVDDDTDHIYPGPPSTTITMQ